jgi:hypothetical protein
VKITPATANTIPKINKAFNSSPYKKAAAITGITRDILFDTLVMASPFCCELMAMTKNKLMKIVPVISANGNHELCSASAFGVLPAKRNPVVAAVR